MNPGRTAKRRRNVAMAAFAAAGVLAPGFLAARASATQPSSPPPTTTTAKAGIDVGPISIPPLLPTTTAPPGTGSTGPTTTAPAGLLGGVLDALGKTLHGVLPAGPAPGATPTVPTVPARPGQTLPDVKAPDSSVPALQGPAGDGATPATSPPVTRAAADRTAAPPSASRLAVHGAAKVAPAENGKKVTAADLPITVAKQARPFGVPIGLIVLIVVFLAARTPRGVTKAELVRITTADERRPFE